MAKRALNNVKLGMFTLAGLLCLILLLYMIGKNKDMFGSTYELKTKFENVQGLVAGHNVRYAGIRVGTVKSTTIVNDTTIEVVMLLEKSMKKVIRKNAMVSIGTDGLVGNKVLNIVAGKGEAPLAAAGDMIYSKRPIDTDEMLRTLGKTNNDVSYIAESLKATVKRLNESKGIWSILENDNLGSDLAATTRNIRTVSGSAVVMSTELRQIIENVKNGKGSVGSLLNDTSIAWQLNEALLKIRQVGENANSLAVQLNQMTYDMRTDINWGKGIVNTLLKDTSFAVKLHSSMDNIEKGTTGFNDIMNAMKHSFLFRGYFKKLEKGRQRTIADTTRALNLKNSDTLIP